MFLKITHLKTGAHQTKAEGKIAQVVKMVKVVKIWALKTKIIKERI